MYALEKAKDLYDDVLNDDASAPKAEAANRLTYIVKALADLTIGMEVIDDSEYNDHITMIIGEAVEENGLNKF